MLDSILNLGKEQLSSLIQEKTQLAPEKTGDAVNVTKDTVVSSLKDELTRGNFDGVMDLFNGKSSTSTSNPIVQGITNSLVGNLVSKLGIGQGVAQQVATIAVPFLMSKLGSSETGRANDKKDLIDQLGFGGEGGLGGILKGLGGMFGGR